MDHWKMFQPIVLASFGVAHSLDAEPSSLLIDGIEPLEIGGYRTSQASACSRVSTTISLE